MIEPARSDADLLNEIHAIQPGNDSVMIWWLGQSGFLLKSREATIVVDPYLSEHLTAKYDRTNRPHVRMTRAPLRGADLTGVDIVLASHKHSDHIDPGTLPDLLMASASACLVLPASLLGHAESLGLTAHRLTGLVANQSIEIKGVRVRAIPSAHEGLDTDDQGRHLYLGFVIEMAGLRFYHSGDSLAYPGLAEAVGRDPIDVMFLPINGRDPSRGVPGNMTAAEAVDLANAVCPRYVVPHHYDMFEFNTVPVAVFHEEADRLGPGVASKVLRCGELWEVHR